MKTLRFDRCRLDTARRELTVDGQLVDLQPLVFDVLEYFAQNPGRTVTKDELLNAVWRSSFVTDSVVARAVMKARRAVMDDASAPKVLRTVPRAGYRFDADVHHDVPQEPIGQVPPLGGSTAPAFALAVLPGLIDSSVGSADAAALGARMACVIHHFLERDESLTLLPMSDVLALVASLPKTGDLTRGACAHLGVREVLTFEVTHCGREVNLRASCGARDGAVSSVHIGNTVWHAAMALVNARLGSSGHVAIPEHCYAWFEPFGQAIRLEQQGHANLALAALQECQTHFVQSPWLDLMCARLHQSVGQFAQGHEQSKSALAKLDAKSSATALLQVQLKLTFGLCAEHLGRTGEAMDACSDALALIDQHPNAQHWRPPVLTFQATTEVQRMDASRSIQIGEQAVLWATALGHLTTEADARIGLGVALTLQGQIERATRALELAVQVARRCPTGRLEARALRAQTLLAASARQYNETVRVGLLGEVVCKRNGRSLWADACTLNIFLALCEMDRLDEAQALHDKIQSNGLTARGNVLAFNSFVTVLRWKQGQFEETLALQEAYCERNGQPANIPQRVTELCWVRNLICIGHLERARELLPRMLDDPNPVRPLLARANLAFADGDRAGCLSLLRQVWSGFVQRDEEVMDAAIDLAWMLLEDAGPNPETEELETLMAHIIDYSNDYPAAVVMSAAYMLRSTRSELGRERWRMAIDTAKVMVRRYPFMATQAFRDALEQGTAPLMTKPLTRLCQ